MVPVTVVSAFRSATTFSAQQQHTTEAMTLVVNIDAAGVDGVAMLELVRNIRGAETDVLGGDAAAIHHHDQQHRQEQQHNQAPSHNLDGVPAGLPAMPVLLVSDGGVHASLAEIFASSEGEENQRGARSSFGRNAGTLCALGAVMRGTAPPRQAFQFACWAASDGKRGHALLLRLLELYPAASIVASAEYAATLLLHASASGDVRMVNVALYHCRAAAEARGFDAAELASHPVAAAGGETPLHRAAAVHEAGGDADVMYELLSTLSKPMAWCCASSMVVGSLLLAEAIGAAAATLVRVVRRYPKNAAGAGDAPSTDVELAIIQEAIDLSPCPAASTPHENARAAMTLELLSGRGSSARLLRVAAHFNANNRRRFSFGGKISGGNHGVYFSAGTGHDRTTGAAGAAGGAWAAAAAASQDSPASLLTTIEAAAEPDIVADALRRWPLLGKLVQSPSFVYSRSTFKRRCGIRRVLFYFIFIKKYSVRQRTLVV